MKFISSKPYELTVIIFDLFCATGLLKCCIRNVGIYCTIVSGSAATQLRWGGRPYFTDVHCSTSDCTRNCARIAKMGQPKAKDIANNKNGTVFQNGVY